MVYEFDENSDEINQQRQMQTLTKGSMITYIIQGFADPKQELISSMSADNGRGCAGRVQPGICLMKKTQSRSRIKQDQADQADQTWSRPKVHKDQRPCHSVLAGRWGGQGLVAQPSEPQVWEELRLAGARFRELETDSGERFDRFRELETAEFSIHHASPPGEDDEVHLPLIMNDA